MFSVAKKYLNRKTICFPKTLANNEMQVQKINCLQDLQLGKMEILEPATNKIINKNKINLFLIPALAVDKKGNRLGFGQGYFDRYLANVSGKKMAVIFSKQFLDCVPHDSWDIKMDFVVNENNILGTQESTSK